MGTWYHIVAVWDGSVGLLYVNGALAATSGATTFAANADAPFTIGMRSDAGVVWAGDADEAALYRVALSPAQISAHYGNGTSTTPVPSYRTLVLNDGPVGYWRLNEPAFVAPVAANIGTLSGAANGTYENGATTGPEAPQPPAFLGFEAGNTALQLDGVNDFARTITGLLNGKPRFTIMGWVRRAADQVNRTALFGQNDIVEIGYINNATLECWTDDGLDVPNAFPNGEWDHVAIVNNGSPGTLTMYTNGVVAGSRASMLPADNAFAFNIGGGGVFDAIGNFFNGQIDEVAVFDQALPDSKICDIYHTAVPAVPRLTRDLPAVVEVFEEDTLSLCVEACGIPPLTYSWYFFGFQIRGQNSSCLAIPRVAGNYSGSYYVEVSNAYGTIASGFCEVNVMPPSPPMITQDRTAVRHAQALPSRRIDRPVAPARQMILQSAEQRGLAIHGALCLQRAHRLPQDRERPLAHENLFGRFVVCRFEPIAFLRRRFIERNERKLAAAQQMGYQ